ncbi:hypothetical protein THAOC_16036, partial [Thalassiosira oceanica]
GARPPWGGAAASDSGGVVPTLGQAAPMYQHRSPNAARVTEKVGLTQKKKVASTQEPTDRGAAEKPNTDIGLEGGVDGPRWTRGTAGTSFDTTSAAFYRSDVISGSETSAGRACAMMHKFAVAPARLIDNGGRRAIGIALRPQHIIWDVLGMNRCHGRRHRATRGGHGGARLSLSSLLAGRADGVLSLTSITSILPGERAQGGK